MSWLYFTGQVEELATEAFTYSVTSKNVVSINMQIILSKTLLILILLWYSSKFIPRFTIPRLWFLDAITQNNTFRRFFRKIAISPSVNCKAESNKEGYFRQFLFCVS